MRSIKLAHTKKNKWVVTSAWPYVNATPHLGNLIGSVVANSTLILGVIDLFPARAVASSQAFLNRRLLGFQ